MRDAHAAVYTAVARTQAEHLGTGDQLAAVARLRLERGNLRAAVRHLVTRADAETACDVAWRLFVFWWVGRLPHGGGRVAGGDARAHGRRRITARARDRPLLRGVARRLDHAPAGRSPRRSSRRRGSSRSRATCSASRWRPRPRGWPRSTARHRMSRPRRAGCRRARRRSGRRGQGGANASHTSRSDASRCSEADSTQATQLFHRGAEASRASGERFAGTVALHHIGRMNLLAGRLDEAEDAYLESLAGSVALRHEEGIAYCLEGLSAVAARRRDAWRAGVLAGAAASIRRRTAAIDAPAFVYHVRFLDELRATDAAEDLASGEAAGLEFGAFEAAQFAAESRSRAEVDRTMGSNRWGHDERHGGTSRDPHARPAAPGVRELDAARAGARAPRRASRRSSACGSRPSCSSSAPVRIRRGSCTAHTSRRATCSSASTADSYGWTAPGEDVSGLEDEYNLAPDGMPKLIYLKDSASRDERLTELIVAHQGGRHGLVRVVLDPRAAVGARRRRLGDAPGGALRGRSDVRPPLRPRAAAHVCRRPTPRRSDARRTSPPCSSCCGGTACAS